MSFAAAVVRAAQLGYDLAVSGITACFSWPSRGLGAAYWADEAACEPSADALADFIRRLAVVAGPGHIHLLAHSMGNRLVLRALERLADDVRQQKTPKNELPLRSILLAAPDVDRDLFRMLMPRCLETSMGQTDLYITRRDRAIWASQCLHSYDRAGLRPPTTTVSGAFTVDATHADLNFELLHHSYYGSLRPVLRDLTQIIHYDATPSDPRRNLLTAGGGTYWQLG